MRVSINVRIAFLTGVVFQIVCFMLANQIDDFWLGMFAVPAGLPLLYAFFFATSACNQMGLEIGCSIASGLYNPLLGGWILMHVILFALSAVFYGLLFAAIVSLFEQRRLRQK